MDRTHDQLVHDLTRKRRELTHDINKLFESANRLREDVEAIDRVMAIFRPDAVPETILPLNFRRTAEWASRGEITRIMFDVLRRADGPLSMVEVTEQVMAARGVEADAITATHKKAVYKALDQQRLKGRIVAHRDGRAVLWSIGQLTGKDGENTGGWRNGASSQPGKY
jgi:hypothetical protein